MEIGATRVGNERAFRTALAASLLLHALALVFVLLGPRVEWSRPAPVREAEIEVVLLPAPASPKPPPPAPRPELPTQAVPPPPPPQLTEAPIAETSTPPISTAPESDPAPPAATPPPMPRAPDADIALGGAARPGTARPARPRAQRPPTQDEKDFILAQILPFWLIDYRNPRFGRFIFRGLLVLRADGTLAPPFGKNDVLEPASVVPDYARKSDAERLAIDSFLAALRAAQPFRLPPGVDRNQYPRAVPVHFRLGDL